MHHHDGCHAGAGFVVVQAIGTQGAVIGAEIFGGGGVHAQGIIAADKNRLGPDIAGHRVYRSNKSERGHQHLVTAADAGCHGRKMQGGGAAVGGHRTGHMNIVGHSLFHVTNLCAAGAHPCALQRIVHIFFFIAAEIRNRKRNKICHNSNTSLSRRGHAPRAAHKQGRSRPAAIYFCYFIIPILALCCKTHAEKMGFFCAIMPVFCLLKASGAGPLQY